VQVAHSHAATDSSVPTGDFFHKLQLIIRY
jgi:hypothetical protein